MEENKKAQNVIQTYLPLIHQVPKSYYINSKCVKKGLKTYYIDRYWIKHSKLQAEYFLDQMRPQRS